MMNAAAAKAAVDTATIAPPSRQRATRRAPKARKSTTSSATGSHAAIVHKTSVRRSRIENLQRMHRPRQSPCYRKSWSPLAGTAGRQVLNIERHHDRIAGLDPFTPRAAPEPTTALSSYDAAVGPHDIKVIPPRAPGQAAALRNIVISGRPWIVQERSRVLHFAKNRYLLL